MKLLIAFALIAAAAAAELKPVVLPRAALPEVVEASPAVKETVEVLDSAPAVEAVRFVDSPLDFTPEDLYEKIRQSELETIRVVQLAFDAVKFVDEAEPQVPSLKVVEPLVLEAQDVFESVRFVDSSVEDDSVAESLLSVRFVDSPAEVQNAEVVKVAEIPQVNPAEDTMKVRVVDFAPQRPGKIYPNDMLR